MYMNNSITIVLISLVYRDRDIHQIQSRHLSSSQAIKTAKDYQEQRNHKVHSCWPASSRETCRSWSALRSGRSFPTHCPPPSTSQACSSPTNHPRVESINHYRTKKEKSPSRQRDRAAATLTSSIMWSHSASERNPLCRNALAATPTKETAIRVVRCVGSEGGEARKIRSSPGVPRELDDAGGVEVAATAADAWRGEGSGSGEVKR